MNCICLACGKEFECNGDVYSECPTEPKKCICPSCYGHIPYKTYNDKKDFFWCFGDIKAKVQFT